MHNVLEIIGGGLIICIILDIRYNSKILVLSGGFGAFAGLTYYFVDGTTAKPFIHLLILVTAAIVSRQFCRFWTAYWLSVPVVWVIESITKIILKEITRATEIAKQLANMGMEPYDIYHIAGAVMLVLVVIIAYCKNTFNGAVRYIWQEPWLRYALMFIGIGFVVTSWISTDNRGLPLFILTALGLGGLWYPAYQFYAERKPAYREIDRIDNKTDIEYVRDFAQGLREENQD
jgi:hypothetical protein